ncbi:hypothetical protein [Pseudomonas iridis]|uniref:hypothetical protein n=1 Tax=Pseudomonas iridis TaxID=2710587 RepID=UPI001B32B9FF|nr:hypothetical protein [Pseudomonas iridis]MBP5971024.1 hypothetical protein [Pseudomonas iridis]
MRLLLLAVLLTLGGCSVARTTSSAVAAYCAVPNPARLANRILVNATIAPHRIIVTCADEVADE